MTLDKCSEERGETCLGTPEEIDEYFTNIVGIGITANSNYVKNEDIDDPIKSHPSHLEYPIG